jgi:DHA1 family bicyclomycin/chloramphenicol resistance-like MFS transporter
MKKNPNINTLANSNLPMRPWELVCLVAALMSLNALAIDIMLPGLGQISDFYGLKVANDQQLIIFAYIIGFGIPQLFFGPVSDRFGRKGLLKLSLVGYILSAIACALTQSFSFLLLMRFIQGVFAAGIRVIAVSIVRDVTAGRAMARIMSMVMTVFMIVPIIAPAIGQGIMSVASWKWTFGVLAIAGAGAWLWVHFRLPETLKPENRNELSLEKTVRNYSVVLKNRVTLGYMTASGIIFGSLFAFIAASEQVFDDVFGRGENFPLWFAIIASSLAVANIANAAVVERFGMRRISHGITIAFIVLSLTNVVMMNVSGQNFFVFLGLFSLTFACFGMMGANFSAIAMEPQGKMAGTASAAYGFATSTVSAVIGKLVAERFDNSITPLLWGFAILGMASLLVIMITERGKLFELGAGKS